MAFGDTWHHGEEPLPWAAHKRLWETLAAYDGRVRYRLGLGGVPRFSIRHEA